MDDFYDDDCYDMDNDYSDEESLSGADVSENENNDEDSGNGEESWNFFQNSSSFIIKNMKNQHHKNSAKHPNKD